MMSSDDPAVIALAAAAQAPPGSLPPPAPLAVSAPVPIAPLQALAAPVAPLAPVLPNLNLPILPAFVPPAPLAPAALAAPVAAPVAPAIAPVAPAPLAPKTVAEGGTALPQTIVDQFGGKFQTVEALAESTVAGQRRITELGQQTVLAPEVGQPASLQFSDAELAPLRTEFMTHGAFSEESKQMLVAKGLPVDWVNQYEQGLQAMGGLYRVQLLSEAGGVPQFNAVIDWASQNLQGSEAAGVDAALNSGDIAQAAPVMQGLLARMRQQTGDNHNLIEPQNPTPLGGNGTQPFHSRAEKEMAMEDPRYGLVSAREGQAPRADPVYAADVEARMLASMQQGIAI